MSNAHGSQRNPITLEGTSKHTKPNPRIWSFSPVVGQEEEVGCSNDNLQPAPVSDVVGEQREDEDANTEDHLEQYAHCSSILHTNNLCHWENHQEHILTKCISLEPNEQSGQRPLGKGQKETASQFHNLYMVDYFEDPTINPAG